MVIKILEFLITWFLCGCIVLAFVATLVILFRLIYLMLTDSGLSDDLHEFFKEKRRRDD